MAKKNNSSRYNKHEQVKRIAEKLNKNDKIISIDRRISNPEAREAYEAVIESLTEMLTELEVGEKLVIPKFLTITKDHRESKIGRNPKKPEQKYVIEGYDTLTIRQSQILKDNIKNKK